MNYNALAEVNDGSCFYANVNLSVSKTFVLDEALTESSGLIFWNNRLWTHHDDNNTKLYALDTANGNTLQNINLPHVINNDWEEISQDDNYVYVGDFGNNAEGNRSDLHILRITKSSILQNAPIIDTIRFQYGNQSNFDVQTVNTTEFDCEAMIVTSDSIYLFKKQWTSFKSTVYRIPKVPGNYTADSLFTLEVNGLVTGATYLPAKKLVALCGYSSAGVPFLYMLYDFPGYQFHKGNKRRMNLNLALHQVEGIATHNGLKYYMTNEKAGNSVVTYPQQMHTIDLTPYLNTYLNPLSVQDKLKDYSLSVWYLNNTLFIINPTGVKEQVVLYNSYAQQVLEFTLNGNTFEEINLPALDTGIYLLYMQMHDVKKVLVTK